MSTKENGNQAKAWSRNDDSNTARTTELDPVSWWRRPCLVAPGIYVCGDLDTRNTQTAMDQLANWNNIGITDIVDLRSEWSDEQFVAMHAPNLSYWWLGTHDNGDDQALEWFDAGVNVINKSVAKGGQVLVHCHMGINRAPSMALAAMLASGVEVVDALARIRAARPIANIAYAENAVAWNGIRNDMPRELVLRDLRRAQRWLATHPADVGWVINRIRTAEVAA